MRSDGNRELQCILTGGPVEAIEAAKRIAGGAPTLRPSILIRIAGGGQYKKWSRIAAVYALGFVGYRASAGALIRILKNKREHSELRSHAAEALGNLRTGQAISGLESVLFGKEKSSLKSWCIYALSEINTAKARFTLVRFAKTKPRGKVAEELRSALRSISNA